MATTSLQVTDIDFNSIKSNLKEYLKSQSEFQDYDFDGAGLSVLLDILAYNTHYLAVYGNFLHNETFLDSAITPSAVYSRAKEIGYTPRSYRAARAKIRVTFTHPGNPNPAIIERGTKFTSTVDGVTYTFLTNDAYSVVPNAGVYTADIDIYQGYTATFQYTADIQNPNVRYTIPSDKIDTDFIVVKQKSSISDPEFTTFALAESVVTLNNNDQIYFVQKNHYGQYEVVFGDGILGQKIETGNIIKLEYLITEGPAANGCAVFSKVSNVAGSTAVTITTLESAGGGAEPETLASVKLVAPKVYQTQERVVTEDDYTAILLREYTNIDSVSVWGGEKNDPPYYGKVFICINPKENVTFSNTVKQQIIDEILAKYNILAIRPDIVDPQYLYVTIDTHVKYNFRRTELTAGQIKQEVLDSINSFFTSELNSFNSTLYFSKLTNTIDETGDYIIGNNTHIELSIRLEVPEDSNISKQYVLNFSNKIQPHTLTSDEFYIDGIAYKLMDWPDHHSVLPLDTGVIRIYRMSGENKVYQNLNAGTIDYNTGRIVLTEFSIDSLVNDNVTYLAVKTEKAKGMVADTELPDFNVYTNGREQLIAFDDINSTITVEGLKLA